MDEISLVIPATYGNQGKYLPLLKGLGNSLCYAYGIGFPRKYDCSKEPLRKMRLTKVPTRLSGFIVSPLGKVFHYPEYYTFWSNVRMCDALFANKVAKDSSHIVFTSPLLSDTVKKAKAAGKIVVVEAGNSEPAREYERITEAYNAFDIKHKYIYGNVHFRDVCMESYSNADYIISISHVSEKTYRDAGYDMNKFKLISLAGTDMPIQDLHNNRSRQRAFISTAYHSFIKGTHHLLRAWQKAEIKDIPLIIVGRICEDMQDFIKRFGPFKNVIYVGHQSNLKEWYKQFDAVGILMSLSEGAVRTTPEMMSFGFPMIVSPDAACDIVRDGINGYVVAGDEEELAERIQWFASDWNRVFEMRPYVLESVSHRTMADYAKELGDFLLSLI